MRRLIFSFLGDFLCYFSSVLAAAAVARGEVDESEDKGETRSMLDSYQEGNDPDMLF